VCVVLFAFWNRFWLVLNGANFDHVLRARKGRLGTMMRIIFKTTRSSLKFAKILMPQN